MVEREQVSSYLALRDQWDQVVRNQDDRCDLYERLTTAWHRLAPDERRVAGAHCCIVYH